MLRNVLAAAVGLALIVVLAVGGDLVIVRLVPDAINEFGKMTDPGVLLLLLVYVFVVDTFGCWVAARIARERPMATALVLGMIALTLASGSVLFLWEAAPAWYHMLTMAGVLPAAWLGGAVARQARVKELATA
jgi:hypothetical protein